MRDRTELQDLAARGVFPLYRGSLATIDKAALLTCPYYLLHRSPAVAYVAEAYEWREVGALSWDACPVPLRRAVTAFARGVGRRRAHDMEQARKDAERDSANTGRTTRRVRAR
jgi:hypothetical protein